MSAAPASAPAATVLRRVASEIGAAADGLALIETQIAALAAAASVGGDAIEKLQLLDRLTQQMRAVEAFLCAASMDAGGDIALGAALDSVLLESVRARLAGDAAPTPSDDVEVW